VNGLNDSIGARFGFDISDLKFGISEANRLIKLADSEFKAATAGLDDWSKSAEGLEARQKQLNATIEAQKSTCANLSQELEKAKNEYGENSKEAQNLETKLNNQVAALRKNEAALSDVNENIENFSEETQEAGKSADKAGEKFEGFGSVLKGVGAVLAATATAIGAAAVGAGKALLDMATDAATAGDRIDKTSQKLGLSAAGFQEWDYVMSQNGASIDSLSAGLNKLNNSVDSALNGGSKAADKAKEKFDRLGISMEDLEGKSREEIFELTIEGLQNITDEGERAAIASSLLGKSAVELAPLLAQTAEGTEELRQKARDLGLVMTDDAVNASIEFTDSIDSMQRSLGGFKNRIGSELLPGLKLITDGLTGVIIGTNGAGEQIKAGAGQVVSAIAGIVPQVTTVLFSLVSAISGEAPQIITSLITGITDNIPMLTESAASIVSSLLAGIITALPDFAAGSVELILSLVQGIIEALPQVMSAATEIIASLIKGIGNALPTLIPAAVEAVVLIVSALIDNIPLLIEAAMQLITGLTEGLLNALPVLIKKIPVLVKALVDALLKSLPVIIETGFTLITALIESLPEIITAIVAAIPQIIDSVIKAVTGSISLFIDAGLKLFAALITALPEIIAVIVAAIPEIIGPVIDAVIDSLPLLIDAGVQLFTAIIENTPAIIKGIVKHIPEIIGGIVKSITDLTPKLADAGLQLIKGLWNGINDAAKWLQDKIAGFFGNVVDDIKEFFGISSPSKLMGDEIGKWLLPGVTDKMKDGLRGTLRDIRGIGKQITGAFSDSITADYGDIGMGIRNTADSLPRSGGWNTGEDGEGYAGGGKVTNVYFTQNNESPNALNALEIDRRTRQGLQLANFGII